MLILYLVAGTLALVWGGVVLRRAGLLGGCIVLMLVACCFGYEFYHVKLGPLPLTLDRLLLGGLCAAYGVSRWLKPTRSLRPGRIDLIFAAFLTILAINTLTHNWRLSGAQPLANLIFLFLGPAVVYWIVRVSDLGPRQVRWLHLFVGGFSLYLAVTAIGEVKQLEFMVWPRYILSSKYQEWLGRARGPFLNPATNGMYMAVGLFAWSTIWPTANRIGKAALLGVAMLVLVGIYCTLTRSCWIAAIAGLALIVFANLPKYWRAPVAIFGLLLAGLVLVAKGDDMQAFKRDKNVSEYHMAQSAKLRPMLAIVAWRMFWDYPLFGCGYGQYKQVNIDYLYGGDSELPLEQVKPFVQHNVLLSLLTETGVLGTIAYLIFLGGWIHHAWRLWRDKGLPITTRQHGLLFCAFFINWFINGMFHDTNLMVNSNLLMFVLAGAAQGLYMRVYASNPQSKSSQTGIAPYRPSLPSFGIKANHNYG